MKCTVSDLRTGEAINPSEPIHGERIKSWHEEMGLEIPYLPPLPEGEVKYEYGCSESE